MPSKWCFHRPKWDQIPRQIHCRKVGTLAEVFSLKHSPSVNANITFLKKEKKKKQLSFSSNLLKKSFVWNIKSIVKKTLLFLC